MEGGAALDRAFGDLISYRILHMDGAPGYPVLRWDVTSSYLG